MMEEGEEETSEGAGETQVETEEQDDQARAGHSQEPARANAGNGLTRGAADLETCANSPISLATRQRKEATKGRAELS
jgi:hypothetical protein